MDHDLGIICDYLTIATKACSVTATHEDIERDLRSAMSRLGQRLDNTEEALLQATPPVRG